MVTDVSQGGCFGYRVTSGIDLRYLRAGGTDTLEIEIAEDRPEDRAGELLREWLPRPGRPAHVRLYGDHLGSRYSMWIDDAGWFEIEPPAGRIFVPPSGRPSRREERLWGIPALLTFLHRGDLPLHAGVVEVGGMAIGFGAPSRHGKTTLAAGFWRRGHRLLTEDLACIRWSPEPVVVPGPAMLRPRVDIADRLHLRDVVEIDRDDDRVHLVLDGARGTEHSAVPLAGFVFLREAADDISLAEVDPMDALRDLWILTFHLGIEEHEREMFQRLADLTTTIPTWNLRRPMSLDALDDTVDAIVKVVAGG